MFAQASIQTLECAFLQTFPRCFRWGDAFDTYGHTFVREMIGEAVPPRFTEVHGRALRALLEGGAVRQLLSSDDVRCRRGASNFEHAESLPIERIARRKL